LKSSSRLSPLRVAVGCSPLNEDVESRESNTCNDGSEPRPNVKVGGPSLAIGLGTAMAGGIIYGSAIPARRPRK
jgi:hypothetical protein